MIFNSLSDDPAVFLNTEKDLLLVLFIACDLVQHMPLSLRPLGFVQLSLSAPLVGLEILLFIALQIWLQK